MKMELLGDNSFYSQRDCTGGFFPNALAEMPEYAVPPDTGKKTGLGSSASMTVAFLAGALRFQDKNIYNYRG